MWYSFNCIYAYKLIKLRSLCYKNIILIRMFCDLHSIWYNTFESAFKVIVTKMLKFWLIG